MSTVVGGNGKFVIGIYNAVLGDYPKSLEELTGQQIQRRIPSDTLVQIRVAVKPLPQDKQKQVYEALTSIGKGEWNIEGITFPAYSIEIAE